MSEQIKIRDGIAEWREVENEIVGIDTRSATYFALNRTGAVLWEDLLRGTTRDELAVKLQSAFALDPEAAMRDVEAFLRSLEASDMLDGAGVDGS